MLSTLYKSSEAGIQLLGHIKGTNMAATITVLKNKLSKVRKQIELLNSQESELYKQLALLCGRTGHQWEEEWAAVGIHKYSRKIGCFRCAICGTLS